MKAHLVILAALTTLAHAHPYPPQPSTNQLIAGAVKDRKVNAPYYAESSVGPAIPTVRELAKPAEVPVLDRIDAAPVNTITPRSAELSLKQAADQSALLRSLEMRSNFSVTGSREMLAAVPSRELPSWTLLTVDPFTLKLEFLWHKPHGQWMNQLLKDISAAKAAGEVETYNTLTARYSAWAEKYLRRNDPPNLDGNLVR